MTYLTATEILTRQVEGDKYLVELHATFMRGFVEPLLERLVIEIQHQERMAWFRSVHDRR